MIYAGTNYATRCKYYEMWYNVKICFLLHAHKSRRAVMCDERKWIGTNEKQKNYLNVLFPS
jgi:hypothetical protein